MRRHCCIVSLWSTAATVHPGSTPGRGTSRLFTAKLAAAIPSAELSNRLFGAFNEATKHFPMTVDAANGLIELPRCSVRSAAVSKVVEVDMCHTHRVGEVSKDVVLGRVLDARERHALHYGSPRVPSATSCISCVACRKGVCNVGKDLGLSPFHVLEAVQDHPQSSCPACRHLPPPVADLIPIEVNAPDNGEHRSPSLHPRCALGSVQSRQKETRLPHVEAHRSSVAKVAARVTAPFTFLSGTEHYDADRGRPGAGAKGVMC